MSLKKFLNAMELRFQKANGRLRIVMHALLALLVVGVSSEALGQSDVSTSSVPAHEKPPRKVVIGTTMTPWYSNYPGLEERLDQMSALVDKLAKEAREKYDASLDVAVFSEYAVTAGKKGSAAEVALAVDDQVLEVMGRKAREYNTYIVFGRIFQGATDTSLCTNSAIVLDRDGRLMGRYSKVHPVPDKIDVNQAPTLEGGVQPGKEYNIFDFDFGRVGIQICFDVEYPEGWASLADQGVELVLFLTQSPQLTRPAMYAAIHEYWIVSSTFRNNASFFEPGTGLVAAQVTDPDNTLVHQIDLSYLVLPWSAELRNGSAFAQAFGDRVGFRYSESEDRGVFWSNDPQLSIGEMARQLNLHKTSRQNVSQAKDLQDMVRGGTVK